MPKKVIKKEVPPVVDSPVTEVVTEVSAEVPVVATKQTTQNFTIGVRTLNNRVITFSAPTLEEAKRNAVTYAQKCGGALLD